MCKRKVHTMRRGLSAKIRKPLKLFWISSTSSDMRAEIKYPSPSSLIQMWKWNIFGGSERRVGGALTYERCQLWVGMVVSSIRLPFSRHLSRILSVLRYPLHYINGARVWRVPCRQNLIGLATDCSVFGALRFINWFLRAPFANRIFWIWSTCLRSG